MVHHLRTTEITHSELHISTYCIQTAVADFCKALEDVANSVDPFLHPQHLETSWNVMEPLGASFNPQENPAASWSPLQPLGAPYSSVQPLTRAPPGARRGTALWGKKG